MHTMIANTTLPPAQAVLAVLGFCALGGLWFLIAKGVGLKMSSWKLVVERFPMRGSNLTGDEYKRQSGVFGNMGDSGGLTIRIIQEGVIVCPRFARRNPCLVPWSAIRRVSISDSSLHVVVDYERTFEFFLPADALPIFKAKLSPELFHKAAAVSPFEVAKAALKDETQPKWVRAISGVAVKFVEKEYEKEKKERGL